MADAPRKLDLLSVDKDVQSRMRVKSATTAVTTFGKFHQAQTLDEALRKLAGIENVDILFIANDLSANLNQFIQNAKQTKIGQDAAYVLIVQANENLQSQMATHMLSGVDGFLQEPFSVDAINEIAQLTVRVKKERAEARELGAIRFLMQQIAEKVSAIAQLKASGLDGRRELRKLVEMCEIFKTLDDEKRKRYQSIALEVFEKAPLPPPTPFKKYGGASSRVRKKLEEKILAKLEGEASAPSGAQDAPKEVS